MSRTRNLLLAGVIAAAAVAWQPAASDQVQEISSASDFYLAVNSCETIPQNVLSSIRESVEGNPHLDIANTVLVTYRGMIGNCWTGKEPDPAVELNIDIHNRRIQHLEDKGGSSPESYLCGVSTMQVSAHADLVAIIHLPDVPVGLSQHDCVEVIVKTLPRAGPGGDDPLGRVYYH